MLFKVDTVAVEDFGLYDQEPFSTILEDIYTGFGQNLDIGVRHSVTEH